MACDINCQDCTTTGGDFVITQDFSPPSSASTNTMVSVSFTVQRNCVVCARPDPKVIVCLYDANGNCKASTDVLDFSTTDFNSRTLNYIQPEENFHGKLAVTALGFIGGVDRYCTDSKIFTVKTLAPPGQGYSCNPVTRSCFQDSQSTKTWAQCDIECRGGGGKGCPGCDLTKNMCIIGQCIDKSLAGLGMIALFAYVILGRK